MNLNQLAGNTALKRQLELLTARRGLSHAYILSGPPGSGRRTLAGLLAAALVCSAPEGAALPCGQCAGCRKAAAGIHPDLIRVGSDGKDISVAQVRALHADAYIRPNEAGRKVYLLENAQSMNASAQNAMLKLLEDGPAYAAFLLVTDNAAALLPTVRSRCESLALSPVSTEEAEAWLRKQFPDKPPEALRAAAAACRGLLGQAAAAFAEESTGDSRTEDTALTLLELLAAKDELRLMELCISLEKWDRESLNALLEEEILLLRDALACSAGAPAGDKTRRSAAAAHAAQILPPKALLDAADKLEKLRTACGFHAGAGHLAGWLCACLSTA